VESRDDMVPPPSSAAVLHDEVAETDSVRGHLAYEIANRHRSESELWDAVARLADCYQVLTLQHQHLTAHYSTLCNELAWARKRQWKVLAVACIVPLVCWILGAVIFRSISL